MAFSTFRCGMKYGAFSSIRAMFHAAISRSWIESLGLVRFASSAELRKIRPQTGVSKLGHQETDLLFQFAITPFFGFSERGIFSGGIMPFHSFSGVPGVGKRRSRPGARMGTKPQ